MKADVWSKSQTVSMSQRITLDLEVIGIAWIALTDTIQVNPLGSVSPALSQDALHAAMQTPVLVAQKICISAIMVTDVSMNLTIVGLTMTVTWFPIGTTLQYLTITRETTGVHFAKDKLLGTGNLGNATAALLPFQTVLIVVRMESV